MGKHTHLKPLRPDTVKKVYEYRMHENVPKEYHYEFNTTIRGYHVYNNIWTPRIRDILQCTWQEDNEYDAHAIAIKQEDGTVVGRVPREFSKTFYFYMK